MDQHPNEFFVRWWIARKLAASRSNKKTTTQIIRRKISVHTRRLTVCFSVDLHCVFVYIVWEYKYIAITCTLSSLVCLFLLPFGPVFLLTLCVCVWSLYLIRLYIRKRNYSGRLYCTMQSLEYIPWSCLRMNSNFVASAAAWVCAKWMLLQRRFSFPSIANRNRNFQKNFCFCARFAVWCSHAIHTLEEREREHSNTQIHSFFYYRRYMIDFVFFAHTLIRWFALLSFSVLCFCSVYRLFPLRICEYSLAA